MSVPQTILFATGNGHKIREVGATLRPLGVAVTGLDSLGLGVPEPVEDGRTFTDNALLKARAYAAATGRIVLAEDSGLVVDALGGAPGVHSARYSGRSGPRSVVDPANNQRLLQEMRGIPDEQRSARFVCVMALCDPHRALIVARGAVEGRIAHAPAGRNGFGYDPLFFLSDRGRTTAELSPEQKNAISHRGQAARRLLAAMREMWPGEQGAGG